MNARSLWCALAGVFLCLNAVFLAKADSIVAGLTTDFWAGFLLSLGVSLAILAVALLHRGRQASPARRR